VQQHAVVEAHDVVGNVGLRLGVVCVTALPDSLRLEAQEEAFHDGVAPAVALAAHAVDQAVVCHQCPVQLAGMMADSIRIKQSRQALVVAARRLIAMLRTPARHARGATAQPTIWRAYRSSTPASCWLDLVGTWENNDLCLLSRSQLG